MSDNREDNIQFIWDGLDKQSLDDIFSTLETHPMDTYIQFPIYGNYSRKNMQDIVSRI